MPELVAGGKMEITHVGVDEFVSWVAGQGGPSLLMVAIFLFEEEYHLLCVGSGEATEKREERTFATVLRGKWERELIDSW